MKTKYYKAIRIKTTMNQQPTEFLQPQPSLNKMTLPFIKPSQRSASKQISIKNVDFKNIKLIHLDMYKDKERQFINQKSIIFNGARENKKSVSHKVSMFPGLNISTKNWCLYDMDNNRLIGFRQLYVREVASLTKIMTAFISIEFLQKHNICLSSIVKVTSTAAALCGTTAQLTQGMKLSFKDLLYGTMLPSGNDSAYSLAEYIGSMMFEMKGKDAKVTMGRMSSFDLGKANTIGYVNEFIKCMNLKCQQLNLFNTRFSNPHGLQNAFNTSTAKDILQLSLQASRNHRFSQIINCPYYKCEYRLNDQTNSLSWWNTNKLLAKGWSGIKTGYTFTAGGCLSSIKNNIAIVVLNCLSSQTRFTDTESIYNWYCNSYKKSKDQIKDMAAMFQTRDIQLLLNNHVKLTKSSSSKEPCSK